jgi:adenine phosphoribosyltransferase
VRDKEMDLKRYIREVQDYPIKGVNFKDITTILQDRDAFRYMVDKMIEPYLGQNIDKIVVIDARGFLLGTAMAYRLNTGVCLVRKEGKLPAETIKESYQKEYGPDILTIHKDTIKKGEKVLVVDDILATGGTVEATSKLVERLGGEIVGMSFIINLPFLGGSEKLNRYNLNWLVEYDSE